jgi:hypothetical protein
MEYLLATRVSLPHCLCRSGRLQLSFLYKLLTLTCRPDTILSKLKLASLKYYTP